MNQVKVTPEIAVLLQTNPWMIINGGCCALVYKTRTEARDAKNRGFQGSIKNRSEIELEIVVPTYDVKSAVRQAEFPMDNLTRFGENSEGQTCCPKCGSTDLFEGRCNEKTGVVEHEKELFGCHKCDWEVDNRDQGPGQPMLPQPANSGEIKIRRKTEITNVSTIERPCKKVWDIAENMPGAKRKDVLEACVQAGIAYYTARTQYQQWLSIRKEMAAEAAARDAKTAAK